MDDMDLSRLEAVSSKEETTIKHRCKESFSTPRNFNCRSSFKDVKYYYDIVVCRNPQAQAYCDKCGFGSLFQFDFSNCDRGIAEALCERWWIKTRSFHFTEFEIGLSPLDYYMLTGVPIGSPNKIKVQLPKRLGGLPAPDLDDIYFRGVIDETERLRQDGNNRKTIPAWDSKGKYLSPTHLILYMESRKGQDNSNCTDELVRVFLIWCIGHFLLANTSNKIHKGWAILLRDVSKAGEYDWGTPSLGNLYHYLDKWSSCRGTEMSGMWMILEFWYYYYFRNMHPVLLDENQDVFPKIVLFHARNMPRKRPKDQRKHSTSDARSQINIRRDLSTVWQPWAHSVHCVGGDYEAALQCSKKRLVFYDHEKERRNSVYLAERHMRQVCGLIVIPCDPPQLEHVVDGVEPEVGTHFWAVDKRQYDLFWRDKSYGALLIDSHRSAQNHDEMGVGNPSVSRSLSPSHPTRSMLSQPYTNPASQEPLSQAPQIDWNVPWCDDNGTEILVPVEKPTTCPYDFSSMSLVEATNLCREMYMYYTAVKQTVFEESRRRYCASSRGMGRDKGKCLAREGREIGTGIEKVLTVLEKDCEMRQTMYDQESEQMKKMHEFQQREQDLKILGMNLSSVEEHLRPAIRAMQSEVLARLAPPS